MRTESKPLHLHRSGDRTTVRVAVEISEAVYDQYAEQAITRGIPVEQLLAERLTRCRTQTHDALVFTAEQKRRFDKAIGHSVSDAEGALQRLQNFMSLDVADVKVDLEPRLIARITSRAKSFRMSFTDCLKREVVAGLRRYAGLDPA